MSKKIVVAVDRKGGISFEYDGFVGNACFTEADRLKEKLLALGVDVEEVKVDRTKSEVEVRRLDHSIQASQK